MVNQLIEKYQNGNQRLEPEEIALATLFPMGQKGLTYLVKDKQATADISEHVSATVAAKVVLDTVRQYERAFEEITSKGTVKQIPREAIDRLHDNVKTMRDTAYKLEQEHAEGIRRANETISAILNIRNALGANK